jgi:hypothetical protein
MHKPPWPGAKSEGLQWFTSMTAVKTERKSVVQLAIYVLQVETLNVGHTITMEMPKLNDDGSLGETLIGQRPVFIPDDYEVAPGHTRLMSAD